MGVSLKCAGANTESSLRDNRLFVEVVRYRYRTGVHGCDLPQRF